MSYFNFFKKRKLIKSIVSLDFESIHRLSDSEISDDLEIQRLLNFSKDLENLINYLDRQDQSLDICDERYVLNENSRFDEVLNKVRVGKNKLILKGASLQDQLVKVQQTHSEETWIKSQFANIFSKLQGVNSIDEFGNILLTHLANAIDAQVGLFYVKDNDNKSRSTFTVNNYFGVTENLVKKEISIGDGIVGHAIFDRTIKIINSEEGFGVDANSVTYGFGRVKLNQLLVIPICYQNQVFSVLEFSTVNKFSKHHIEYLNQITEGIGLSIKNILNNMLTEKLLTEIKESNKSLASQKQALDSSAIVAETDLRGRITYVNQKFIEISKYSKEELIGQDHRILNSRFHEKTFFIDLWKTISRGDVWHGEVKNRNKNGEFYWVDTTIYPIKNADDKIIKYIAIRFDITDKKRMLEELQEATKKANIAVKTKTDFLANMSHEIRTPMNAIIGMADVLSETQLTSEQSKYVKVINNAGLILLDVINSILDLSKIEAGQLNLEKIEFNLFELLDSIITVMSNPALKKNLHLIVDVELNVPERIIGDPSRLRQVLINLMANAIKFTNEGEIYLKVKLDREDNSNLFFSVKDSGIGIAFENYSKIFSVFSQANTSTSRQFGGTGLGLSISKKIVDSFGGKINFISEFGRGSDFFFTCPHNLSQFSLNASYSSLVSKIDKPSKSILYYEPNKTLQKIYEKMFDELKLDCRFVNEIEDVQKYDLLTTHEFVFLNCMASDEKKLERFLTEITDPALIKKLKVFMLTDKDQTCFNNVKYSHLNIECIVKPFYQHKIIRQLQSQQPTEKQVIKINKPETGDASITSKPLRILVVDDVIDNIDIIKIYLRDYPFTVDCALNGNEALTNFKKNKYDLILMDIQMPFMDGNETMKKIRLIEKEQNLPPTKIIMLSAHATTDEMEHSKHSGCDGYLTKPIKKKTLIDTLDTVRAS